MRKKKHDPVDVRQWRHLRSNAVVLELWLESMLKYARGMKPRYWYTWQREDMLRKAKDNLRSIRIILRNAERLQRKFDALKRRERAYEKE